VSPQFLLCTRADRSRANRGLSVVFSVKIVAMNARRLNRSQEGARKVDSLLDSFRNHLAPFPFHPFLSTLSFPPFPFRPGAAPFPPWSRPGAALEPPWSHEDARKATSLPDSFKNHLAPFWAPFGPPFWATLLGHPFGLGWHPFGRA
jgi:hypothetical protein